MGPELPAPESGAANVPCAGSLLTIVRVPVCGPVADGANRTTTACCVGGEIVKGRGGVTMVKRAFELVIDATVRSAPPMFLIASVRSLAVPLGTLPKSKEAGFRVMAGGGTVADPGAVPGAG